MGGVMTADTETLRAISAVIYSAYSVILEELVDADPDRTLADSWLRLTALGMRIEPAALARAIYDYNEARLKRTGVADD